MIEIVREGIALLQLEYEQATFAFSSKGEPIQVGDASKGTHVFGFPEESY